MNVDDKHFTPARGAAGQTPHLSLAELTDRAGVTVRTVRYYIAEGLLPPPLTAGRQSAYTEGHLDRLQLIARLKDAYLPLREIRRRLAGLDDQAVRDVLEQDPPDQLAGPEAGSARAYLDRLLPATARPSHSDRPRPQERQQLLREASPEAERYAAAATYEPPMSAPPRPLTIGTATPLSPAQAASDPGPENAASEAWRRVRLADDAELLIRESAYRQRRDRIDWLIRWARRVFG